MLRTAMTMRSALVAAAMVLLGACSSDGIDTFRITESATTTVPKGTLLEELVGNFGFDGFTDLDLTTNQTLQNQGVKRSQIDSVRLTKLTLEITSPADGQTFDFLSKIEFFVQADGVAKKRLASKDPIDGSVKSFACDLDGLELAPYVAAPSMDITTAATGKRPKNETTIKATMELLVDVNVSGLLD